MSDFVKSLSVEEIRIAAERDAAAILSDLAKRDNASELGGFAICTISDATSVYWTAETGPQLANRVQDLISSIRRHDPDSMITEADAENLCRFEPADWSITETAEDAATLDQLNAAIDKYWDQFDELPDSDEKILEHAPAAARVVLHAIGEGLQAACAQIDWQSFGGRDELTVLVWVNDPDEPAVVRKIAKKLNPEEIFEEFSATYFPDDEEE